MNAAQIREASRLVEGQEDRAICRLVELGEPGCQLTIGEGYPGAPRARWIVETSGSSYQVEGEGL